MKDLVLPEEIKSHLVGASISEVSHGESQTKVYKIIFSDKVYYLKVGSFQNLNKEYQALAWLQGKLLIPKIIEYVETKSHQYLLTNEIKGMMVWEYTKTNNQESGIKIIAKALRAIQRVNINDCPINVDINYKLALCKYNLDHHYDILITQVHCASIAKFGSLEAIYQHLLDNKFSSEPCFSHGDTSLTNIIANDDKFNGLIDIGECGIADKWFDIALTHKSIIRNYGAEYLDLFYQELGVKPDLDKLDYYILMMELYL